MACCCSVTVRVAGGYEHKSTTKPRAWKALIVRIVDGCGCCELLWPKYRLPLIAYVITRMP